MGGGTWEDPIPLHSGNGAEYLRFKWSDHKTEETGIGLAVSVVVAKKWSNVHGAKGRRVK
jgi:hypothetical protein